MKKELYKKYGAEICTEILLESCYRPNKNVFLDKDEIDEIIKFFEPNFEKLFDHELVITLYHSTADLAEQSIIEFCDYQDGNTTTNSLIECLNLDMLGEKIIANEITNDKEGYLVLSSGVVIWYDFYHRSNNVNSTLLENIMNGTKT